MERDYNTRKKGYDIGIPIKKIDDILEDINFDSEDEKLLCKDIIISIENFAAQKVLDKEVVSIPHIGAVWMNPFKEIFIERKNEIDALKDEPKETKIEFIRNIYRTEEGKLKQTNYIQARRSHIKKANKKLYEKLFAEQGMEVAEKMIDVISRFKIIEFNEEVEEVIQELYAK